MIPAIVEEHLKQHHEHYGHTVHEEAMTAQDLAAAEHVTGRRVAKPVIVRMGDELAFAVVRATDKVNLSAIEEATGQNVELASESAFGEFFRPCEVGAEPPLGLFGLPIFVDERLTQERTLVMPAGTHRDAIELDVGEWLRCEGAQPVFNLGVRV
jgi:Ala-tRNA(Pro) deacylase